MSVLLQVCKRHVWRELESNNLGQPILYKCINCLLEFRVKKDIKSYKYFDKRNSIFNRIKENEQKIQIIKNSNSPIGINERFNERLHIDYLINENIKLREILNKIK